MRVTIGLPFYNNAASLPEAIQSVFAQSFQDWELILVDDGSTDESLAIARSVQDDRVRVISDGRNRQLSYRLNQIAELARGQYVARMDADDLMTPDRIERQIAYLDSHPEFDLLSSSTFTIDLLGQLVGLRTWEPRVAKSMLVHGPNVCHPTVLARQEWFLQNRYDGTYLRAEDYELWCRSYLNKTYKIGYLAQPTLFYRQYGQTTISKLLPCLSSCRAILKQYGAECFGRRRTIAYMCLSYARTMYGVASICLGIRDGIARRKQRHLTRPQRASAEKVLRTIHATEVPGLTSHLRNHKIGGVKSQAA